MVTFLSCHVEISMIAVSCIPCLNYCGLNSLYINVINGVKKGRKPLVYCYLGIVSLVMKGNYQLAIFGPADLHCSLFVGVFAWLAI